MKKSLFFTTVTIFIQVVSSLVNDIKPNYVMNLKRTIFVIIIYYWKKDVYQYYSALWS